MYGKYFPHDLAPSPNFPLYGEMSFRLVLSDQFSIQSAPFFIVGFLKLHIVYLFRLISKQRNIFTISRNSIWAPASINFSAIAKCPSKHALWRAVRLYCQRRDLKRERERDAYKNDQKSFLGSMKLRTAITSVVETWVLLFELEVPNLLKLQNWNSDPTTEVWVSCRYISKCSEVYMDGCEPQVHNYLNADISLSWIPCLRFLCRICHADQTVFFHLGLLLGWISKSIQFFF